MSHRNQGFFRSWNLRQFVRYAEARSASFAIDALPFSAERKQVAQAIRSPGGMEAVNLKVAEKYVEAFAGVAKQGNTLILPDDMAEMGGAAAMSIVNVQK